MAKTNTENPESEAIPAKRFSWNFRLPRSRKERALTIAGAVVAAVLIVLAIPYSRYGLIGQFVKRPATVDVVDSRSHKPISDVKVTVGPNTYTTDAKGEIKLSALPVGSWSVVVNKRYYNLLSTSIMQPLFGSPKTFTLNLVAIGNQITVKVTNKITGKPLAKAEISALGTTAATDTAGMTTIVLPTGRASVPGTVKLPGYNDQAVTIKNTETDASANTFALVPTGKIFYLDKRTGTINVMKANLDGSDPEVIVAGTGKESDTETVLLASRDWKYLALQATRDSKLAKLYVIDAATGHMGIMDEGNASFNAVGWDGDKFIYTVDRTGVEYWQAQNSAIKSYDATNASLHTLYENHAEGPNQFDYAFEDIGTPALLGTNIMFAVNWSATFTYSPRLNGKNISVMSVAPDGSNLHSLKDFAVNLGTYNSISMIPYEPDELALSVANGGEPVYYAVSDGKVATNTDINQQTFNAYNNATAATYLLSPSGNQTLWYDQRDGKNTLFTGDASGSHPKTLAALSDFTPFGWYTDNYLLLSKNKSELYIVDAGWTHDPVKITDYHKPALVFNGYGGGYGGQ